MEANRIVQSPVRKACVSINREEANRRCALFKSQWIESVGTDFQSMQCLTVLNLCNLQILPHEKDLMLKSFGQLNANNPQSGSSCVYRATFQLPRGPSVIPPREPCCLLGRFFINPEEEKKPIIRTLQL